jgi:dihydroorotase
MLDSILIKDVTIVFPDDIRTGDILIKDGKIAAVDASLTATAEKVIREAGLILMPGVIDPHVHFRDPGYEWKEDFETGSMAAAAGGVTSIFDMPNTNPPTIDRDSLAKKKALALEKSIVNYNCFIGATRDNLEECIKAENIPGIKVFMGSSTGSLLLDRDEDLDRLFSNGSKLIAVHAESESIISENQKMFSWSKNVEDHMRIRSVEAATEAFEKAVYFSNKYKRRLHICHLTTQEEAAFLCAQKTDLISAEVSPHHLFLSAPEVYAQLGVLAQVNPPIRENKHRNMLWKALMLGAVSCIATDHAPHTLKEKNKEFGLAPSGVPGIETSLPLMLDMASRGDCSLLQIAKWMSEGPAKTFNIKNKGQIQKGYDADFVLIDLKAKRKIHNNKLYTKSKWSPFNGKEIAGWPVATFVNGQMVFREGDFFKDIKGKEVEIGENTI